ncbi:hypothetical protein WJX81_000398 [Elliptochloris bilobata]|uniref:ApaG domain-containing protein n=1 Tax=Elliptochloris bilobata TaxID=381761 RepID=A0AAW1QI24_9CHLO
MLHKRLVLTCYRAALREARRIDCQVTGLAVRAPVIVESGVAQHCWSPPTEEYRLDALRELLPGMLKMPRSATFRRRELKRLIRDNYVRGCAATGEELSRLLDLAVAAVRVMKEQLQLQRCSSIGTTHGCRVECTTAFAGASTDGYTYMYRCRIENLGRDKVHLVGRHLVFRDERGATIKEVPRGSEGVVGCTPTLRPKDCFQYHSFINMPGPVGTMRGAYHITTKPQQAAIPSRTFDAVLAPCKLLKDPT